MTKLAFNTEAGTEIEISLSKVSADYNNLSDCGISIQVTGEIGEQLRSHLMVITPLQAVVMAAKLNKIANSILTKDPLLWK